MGNELLLEIRRIKEIMFKDYYNLIIESVNPSYFFRNFNDIDNIFNSFSGKRLSEFVNDFNKSIDDIVDDKFKNFIKTIKESGVDSTKALDELLESLKNGKQISESSLKLIYNALIKSSDFVDDIVEQTIKNSGLEEKFIKGISQTDDWKTIKGLGYDAINEFKDGLKKIIKNEVDLPSQVRDRLVKIVDETYNLTKPIDELNDVKKNLNNNLLKTFKDKWYKMMKDVESQLGQPYPMNNEQLEQFKELLEILNKKTFGEKLFFTVPNVGLRKFTVDEILESIKNYKVLLNSDGNVSILNKLDTHSSQSIEVFLEYIKKQKDSNEIMTKLISETPDGKVIDDILSRMKNDNNFWDELLKNESKYSSLISQTSALGDQAEQYVVKNIKKIFGDNAEIVFDTSISGLGNPMDRLLGVDLVVKIGDEYKFIQVKRVRKIMVLDVTDESAYVSIFGGPSMKLQKPSQIDNFVYVGPNNETVVGGVNNLIKYDVATEKLIELKTQGKAKVSKTGYIDLKTKNYLILDAQGGTLQKSPDNGITIIKLGSE